MKRALAALLLASLAQAACAPAVVIGGVAAGTYVASDRRSMARQIDDRNLEALVERRLQENFGDRIHVNVTAFDGALLLTGETPNDELRKAFQELVRVTPGVRRMVDETKLAPLSSTQWRLNDSAMTAKVKSRLANSDAFNVAHVKVVTEANEVFLLGRVTAKEAEAAVELARTTSAVNRVVSVFDIVAEDSLRKEVAADGAAAGGAKAGNGK